MARKKNSLLRTIIPLAAILAGVGVVAAVAVNSANQTRNQPASPTAPAAPANKAGSSGDEGTPPGERARNDSPASESASDQPGRAADSAIETAASSADGTRGEADEPEIESLGPLHARTFEDIPEAGPIGSLDGVDGQHIYVEFSRYGAGVKSLKLGKDYYETIEHKKHVELQSQRSVSRPGRGELTAVPLAALSIEVNGEVVSLAAPGIWRPVPDEPGVFEAFIDDERGEPVLRLERRYRLVAGTFRLEITRSTRNLTDKLVRALWSEAGPIDLPVPTMGYGGDKRRVRFGYLFNDKLQAGSTAVTADRDLKSRASILGKPKTLADGSKMYEPVRPIWPTPKTEKEGDRLVWTAFTGRYFGVALHPIFDPDAVTPGGAQKVFDEVDHVDRLVLNPMAAGVNRGRDAVMLMRLVDVPELIAPGGVSTRDKGVYAGPLLKHELNVDALSRSLNLEGLIAYNFGGMCGSMCTFGWLTHVLIFVLRAAHSLTHDWAASIILLVLIVRTSLHPITRWSQIRLQRFSKQMQALGPKQAKLREKYKDDPKRLQQEMARLWKEEGINPAGALGCLPMFLQSPVWIALYATLYFATEMRHQPGFWGVFQAISGGQWHFLADLSSPDAALPLPKALQFTPPVLGALYGKVESINLLPILMAVLFYMHQKYLSPPPSASMTPEQESQQKLMKILFPIMMPVFMYPAPSGLLIYFITNSALAIIENKHIRSTAEKQGLLDPEKIKAEKAAKRAAKKSGGLASRLQALAEEREKMQAQGRKKVPNRARPEPKNRNYKKRK